MKPKCIVPGEIINDLDSIYLSNLLTSQGSQAEQELWATQWFKRTIC